MKTALLLIDFQNDYFSNGKMPLEKGTEALQKAQEAVQLARSKQMPIIHIQHVSTRPDATYFLPCTTGVEFHANLQPQSNRNETIIKKHYPNSFKDTTLLNYLTKNKIDHLVIAGLMTHLCIDATVRAAYDLNFTCTVLYDACATKNLEFHNALIPASNVQGACFATLQNLYANIISTREFIQSFGTATSAQPAKEDAAIA